MMTPSKDLRDTFESRLKRARLSVTRPRLALAQLVFGSEHRHISAADLEAEAKAAGIHVATATIYNFLKQLAQAGMLRQVGVEGGRAYFDTNTSDHNHFFIEDEHQLLDIPEQSLRVEGLPPIPDGMEITHIDVVVRLARQSLPAKS